MNGKDLLPYALACHPNYKTKCALPNQDNKGTLKEANAQKEYQCHNKESILKEEQNKSHSWSNKSSHDVSICVLCVINNNIKGFLPSNLLSNKSWVDKIFSIFDPNKNLCHQSINNEMKSKTDSLTQKLQGQLVVHIQNHIRDPTEHKHWWLKWAIKNLSHVVACMILFGLTIKDTGRLDEMACLLSMNQNNFLLCSNIEATHLGCYLYWDTNNCAWICSGKVTGRGFGVRHNKYALRAKASGKTSTLHTTYPSERGDFARSTNAE